MANPNGRSWRHARAEHDLSVDDAAARLGIKAGSLRNIETDQPNYSVGERLVYRAARLYGLTYDALVIEDADEGDKPKPAPKPKREKDPSSPPPRKDEGKKGPKRSEVAA